ncbi:MAG: FkbM family methyltransferase [Alphaproteobacteria bacterium]
MPTSGTDGHPSGFDIAIAGGVTIRTPANIRLMTPYILLEQEDWFEEETGFLRSLIEPGETVIDIGANYGVYAASLAAAVGETGRIVAIEPAASTARYLTATLAGFPQAVTVQAALGEVEGDAILTTADNSETNRLVDATEDNGASETVALRRFDDIAADFGVADPGFIKLDAEGAELRILTGAVTLMREADPLIMFERKHGPSINTDLINGFEALGFGIFQLLPGPGILAPYDPNRTDAFGLNLFAAKPGRAEKLADAGRLVTAWPDAADKSASEAAETVAWLLEQATALAAAAEDSPDGATALAALLAFARVSRGLGLRRPAIDALGRALMMLQSGEKGVDPTALPPDPDFDETPPDQRDLSWLTAATITAYERARNYSSYFTDQSTLPLLDRLRETPHAVPEMLRRRQLMQVRNGQRQSLEWEAGFDAETQRNPTIWRGEINLGL